MECVIYTKGKREIHAKNESFNYGLKILSTLICISRIRILLISLFSAPFLYPQSIYFQRSGLMNVNHSYTETYRIKNRRVLGHAISFFPFHPFSFISATHKLHKHRESIIDHFIIIDYIKIGR